jgi:anti-sigma factor RsiW
MTTTTHPVAPEDVMAYLDGELSSSEARVVVGHLGQCAACAELVERLQRTSKTLHDWQVPAASQRIAEPVMTAVESCHSGDRTKSVTWFGFPRGRMLMLGIGGLAGVLVVFSSLGG